MLKKQPAKMAIANVEQQGKLFDGFGSTVFDEPQGAGDGGGRTNPGGQAGRDFRTASQAGSESGFLRRSRRREESTVGRFWCVGGADRAAVDARACDAHEDLAVEPGVARAHRAKADF